jgi:anti-sigma factor RsiW
MDLRHCDEALNQDYVLGALDPREAEALESHLSGCPACALQVRQYRLLFRNLADLPLPAVPDGIASRVLARLRAVPEAHANRSVLGLLIRRPAFAAAAGGLLGFAIAVFHEPLILLFGRMTGGIVAGGATQLVTGIRSVLRDLSVLTGIVQPVVGAILKLEPVVRALGEAIRAVPAQASTSSVLLSLATAILLARLLGQVRREKLGHAKF